MATEHQTITYSVEVCENHDGGSVWISDEEFLETREEADELAAKRSRTVESESARVMEVTRVVVRTYESGKVSE